MRGWHILVMSLAVAIVVAAIANAIDWHHAKRGHSDQIIHGMLG